MYSTKRSTEQKVSTEDIQFGKPINFKNTPRPPKTGSAGSPPPTANQMGADAMVSQYINIKNNYKGKILEVLGTDKHAARLFCHNDVAYIFDVHLLRALVKTIEGPGFENPDSKKFDGCVILFQGVRKDAVDPTDPKKGCVFGRPTLIAVPYRVNDQGLAHEPIQKDDIPHKLLEATSVIDANTYDGLEHPGNGTSPAKLTIDGGPGDFTSPVVDHAQSEDDDTDYSIKTLITDIPSWT